MASVDPGNYLKPTTPSHAKKGHYIQIKGHPVKVAEMSTSKTGKHGHAKVNLMGYCVLTGKKLELMAPAHSNHYAPVVNKTEYALIDIDDGQFNCLDEESEEKNFAFDEENELHNKIKDEFDALEDNKEIVLIVLTAPKGDINKMEVVEAVDSHRTQEIKE